MCSSGERAHLEKQVVAVRQALIAHGANAVVRRLDAAPATVAVDLARGSLKVLHEDGQHAARANDGGAVAQHVLDVVAHALVRRALFPRLLLEIVRKPAQRRELISSLMQQDEELHWRQVANRTCSAG